MEGDGVIATLSFTNLKKIIGDNWKLAMEKNEKSHEVFIEKLIFFFKYSNKIIELLIFKIKLKKFLRKSVARPTKKLN